MTDTIQDELPDVDPIRLAEDVAYRRAYRALVAQREYIAKLDRERCHTADDEGRAA